MRWGMIKVSVGIAAAVLLVAGCSDKQSGTATPATTTGGTTSTGPTTPTTGSNGGAPEVKVPLDASRFTSQPCTALSAAALKQLNISKPGVANPSGPVALGAGPYCVWHSDDQPLARAYDVGFITGNKNGLSDTYRGGKSAFPGYFEPAEVDGYPAVFNDLIDDRSSGSCNITVGISSSLAFRVGTDGGKDVGAKSCDVVKQVAATVIQTVKGE